MNFDIPSQPDNTESLEVARNKFRMKLAEFRDFEDENGIEAFNDLNLDLLKDNIEKNSNLNQEEKERLIDKVKGYLLEIADLGVNNDVYLYCLDIYDSLGAVDKIKARIKKGYRSQYGWLDVALARAVFEHGDEEQSEALLKDWIKENEVTEPDFSGFEECKYFREKLAIISEQYKIFANKYNLPEDLPFKGAIAPKTSFINAACELKKGNYDLVIGVLKSGMPITQLLDFLGQNTRYLEWHKRWKQEPRWKNIGSNTKTIKSAGKILVCEHDTQTGATLKAISPILKKLSPKEVDVSFWVDFHHKNEENIANDNFYNKSIALNDISTDNLIENLKEMVEYAKSMKI